MNRRHFNIFLLSLFIFSQGATISSAKNELAPMTCEERLKHLEPSTPKTIYDYELMHGRDISMFSEEVLPISLVKKNGSTVPFVTVFKDLNFQRPAYYSEWHSSNWRWSYVPINMANQQHKVFAYLGGLSWWYDLSTELALPPGADGPSPINESAFTIKYPYVIRLIVFNFDIKTIKYYKNQIVIFGEPLRKGLTLIDFDMKNFSDSRKLLQLSTPDGYEIDYLILY